MIDVFALALVEDRRPDQMKRYVKARAEIGEGELRVYDRRGVLLTRVEATADPDGGGYTYDAGLVKVLRSTGCACGGTRTEDIIE